MAGTERVLEQSNRLPSERLDCSETLSVRRGRRHRVPRVGEKQGREPQAGHCDRLHRRPAYHRQDPRRGHRQGEGEEHPQGRAPGKMV